MDAEASDHARAIEAIAALLAYGRGIADLRRAATVAGGSIPPNGPRRTAAGQGAHETRGVSVGPRDGVREDERTKESEALGLVAQ